MSRRRTRATSRSFRSPRPCWPARGAIATLLVLVDEHASARGWFSVGAGAVAALLLSLAVLRSAAGLAALIPPRVSDALGRITGLLLIAIGVQFIQSAVAEWIRVGVHVGGP
ncbi:MAG: MarC family protein [Actinomycetota bacterium]|nr:MarC family protein [Actinomycetota bacterium]